jgi:hypothetical protein
LLDTFAQFAAGGFSGSFDALASNIKFPTMKGAAYTVTFMATKSQVSASVRAISIDQAPMALLILK